ncbi:DUF3293 domain-containing protein [Allofrancisella guangzhouensis]|uniref:DUF3293 domain-containing protein n=1 Tax=Allofrancisella guangzhouensis TaxID=594679 RepID=A0A0A8E6B2_9GAMM|nr:DUF3293 domain-containing protein [Allofrancisella guangzhouensis]AJC49097.1 hypothetical protein SD28_05340 [Allofrancisella guangzhouensis]MBK2026927.1 DUF3293 domain-containing protein [Allofrancisella guangzhouensis]MBK2044847.1 DUF3293 domain-containing protein [Allofrancisella guangzhouensis]MBK2046307.1 DUF3293 domain-containing protein [Allofrancisella guangzhouensis]
MNNSSSMPDWYFTTKFELPIIPEYYPSKFAIITAFNPMNQELSLKENTLRNKVLENELKQNFNWIYQINGFDCTGHGHKENGFMFEITSIDDACDLGLKFSQDAIYYVKNLKIYVVKCAIDQRKAIEVGDFLSRIV